MTLGTIHSTNITDVTTTIGALINLEMTVSIETLRFVFPHLLLPAYHHLKGKMLGQRLYCAANAHYVLGRDGPVAEVDWAVDFVAALQRILSIEETALVLQQAQIMSDVYLLAERTENPDHHRISEYVEEENVGRYSDDFSSSDETL